MSHRNIATFFLSLLLCLALCPAAGLCLSIGGPSVAVVDVEKVLTDSKGARQANAHLAEVQKVLQKGMDDYQAEIAKSPDGASRQELLQGRDVLQRQLILEQNAARDVVMKHMRAQVGVWHAKKPDFIVVARQNLLAAPAQMDITAEIIALMDAAGDLAFAALPRVVINGRTDAAAAPAEPAKPAKDAAPEKKGGTK